MGVEEVDGKGGRGLRRPCANPGSVRFPVLVCKTHYLQLLALTGIVTSWITRKAG